MATALQHKMVGNQLLLLIFTVIITFPVFIQGAGGVNAAYGGIGYGAGGAGGGATSSSYMYAGGNGANGLVYIEWD